ncbi:MAG: MBL fold metallo-hydrolase [Deltaproteobacteria bacterium]|nr:MAG: MBL fold metallo-hydrolase [Deltaproteobacteria bacterium]
MLFRQLFDRETSTYTYLLADEASGAALLIDPVLDQVDRDLGLLEDLGLSLTYILETHVHADHVTGAAILRDRTGARTVVSATAGADCADVAVRDGDVIRLGASGIEVRQTPGHTAGCVTYVTQDQKFAFTGDALMIRGCGRTDFQEGDAHTLYASVHEKIFTLPDACAVYPGHDYKGRTQSTVGEEKRLNPRLGGDKTVEEFAVIMDGLGLAPPKHLAVSLPANRNCGRILPESTAP